MYNFGKCNSMLIYSTVIKTHILFSLDFCKKEDIYITNKFIVCKISAMYG